MNLMRIANLLLVFAVLPGVRASAEDNSPVYTQSYVLLIKGSPAGNEKVTESINEAGNIVSASDHEILLTDGLETKRMAFSTKLQLSKNSYLPISYSYKYTGGDSGDSYEVSVKGEQISRTLIRNGHSSEVEAAFQPNTVILDFNVYHQYDYLVRRYDVVKGGRQVFSDFVPLIGTDIPLALTALGDSELKYENGSIPVSNYRFEFVGITGGTLSVDKNKRLVRVQIPAQDLEVVRKDLLPATAAN